MVDLVLNAEITWVTIAVTLGPLAFAAYFLTTGMLALVNKRMRIVDPHADHAWPGVFGTFMHPGKKSALDNALDEATIGSRDVLRGNDVKERALFHIVFGVGCLVVAVVAFLGNIQ